MKAKRHRSAGWSYSFDSEPDESDDDHAASSSLNIPSSPAVAHDNAKAPASEFDLLVQEAEREDALHVPQEIFDLSRVPEKAQFVETPFTIARRLAAQRQTVSRSFDTDEAAERPAKRAKVMPRTAEHLRPTRDPQPAAVSSSPVVLQSSSPDPPRLSDFTFPARRQAPNRSLSPPEVVCNPSHRPSPVLMEPRTQSPPIVQHESSIDRLKRFRAPTPSIASSSQPAPPPRTRLPSVAPSPESQPSASRPKSVYRDLPASLTTVAVSSQNSDRVFSPEPIRRPQPRSFAVRPREPTTAHQLSDARSWSTLKVPVPQRNPYCGPQLGLPNSSASLATRFTLPGLFGRAGASRGSPSQQSGPSNEPVDRQFKRRE